VIRVERGVRRCSVEMDGECGEALLNAVFFVHVRRDCARGLVVSAVTRRHGAAGDGGARLQRVGGGDVGDADDRLVDEDDGDEHGEALLGEAGDVADQRAQVERHGRRQQQRHPDADPQTKRQELNSVLSDVHRKPSKTHSVAVHYVIVRPQSTVEYTSTASVSQ